MLKSKCGRVGYRLKALFASFLIGLKLISYFDGREQNFVFYVIKRFYDLKTFDCRSGTVKKIKAQ